jgi:haloalkane dehalogenase
MSSRPALEHSFTTVSGHQIAYLDSGRGRQTLLMLHGNPVSAHVYRRLMANLRPDYRCVAPDLLGFGLSDKPPRETDYSLPRHTEIVAEFVRALDLRNVALVAHDWGGPIGLGAALEDKKRYTHLVLLNTLTEAPMKIRPRYWLPFHVLLRLKRLADYLVKERNLFQKMGVASMDEADQAVYLQANHSAATRAGIAAFPRMIPYHRKHPNYPLLRDILSRVEAWDIPALVLFSDQGSVFSAGQGRRLAKRMKNAQFGLVAGARHFLQYEQASEVAAAIDDFLRER